MRILALAISLIGAVSVPAHGQTYDPLPPSDSETGVMLQG